MGFNVPSTFYIHILCNNHYCQCCSRNKFKMADIPHKLELSSAYYHNDWTNVHKHTARFEKQTGLGK
jgi:hypothetical protein